MSNAQQGTGSNANLNRGSQFDLRKTTVPQFSKVDAQLEKKRASLDVRHKFVIDKAAEIFFEKPMNIENQILTGNKLDVLNDFFNEGGSRKVVLVWQTTGPSPKVGHCCSYDEPSCSKFIHHFNSYWFLARQT